MSTHAVECHGHTWVTDNYALVRQPWADDVFGAHLTQPDRSDGAARLLDAGRLTQLTPSLYGSRKTGVPHTPWADGWELLPGTTPLAELIAAVPRGALVDRLSMGEPAPNGDFSGVIKNSFRLDGGRVGGALAETMISGNVARMLLDVAAVSAERIDSGSQALPWVRISGLHFS